MDIKTTAKRIETIRVPGAGPAKATEEHQSRYYPFDQRPLSDSCWATHTGPDGRVYAASCIEHTGGESATIVRFDEQNDRLEYLVELDQATGDLRDSGRATQCKIHYSFAPDVDTGLMYAATHLSGPPKGEHIYNPWASWHDPQRAFRGSYLIALDTRTDRVVRSELMIPKEGCRCLCLDRGRRRLYALTYPRDHFVYYDLESKRLCDLGRLGSVNSQCIFMDRRGRAYTFADTGRLIRFDPDLQRLEQLPHLYPHEPCQSAWHGVLYDAVEDPASGAIYMIPWKSRPHLARFWPEDGPQGRLEDLGLLGQRSNDRLPTSINLNHVGGLVAVHPWLYYVKAAWDGDAVTAAQFVSWRTIVTRSVLCRIHMQTLENQEVCTLASGLAEHYVARGAQSAGGDLFFGKVMGTPVGVYRVRGLPRPASLPLRTWG